MSPILQLWLLQVWQTLQLLLPNLTSEHILCLLTVRFLEKTLILERLFGTISSGELKWNFRLNAIQISLPVRLHFRLARPAKRLENTANLSNTIFIFYKQLEIRMVFGRHYFNVPSAVVVRTVLPNS